MDKFLTAGLFSDVRRELENFEKEKEKYSQINSLISNDEDFYDDLLLELTTAELKQVIGLLTRVLKDVKEKGFNSAIPIFNMLEQNNLYKIAIFYARRIIEKNISTHINLKAHEKLIELFLKFNQAVVVYYFPEYLNSLNSFIKENINDTKDILLSGANFYKLLYIYYITVEKDNEKAFGYLLKSYRFNKQIIEKYPSKFEEFNNLLVIINIIGMYTYLPEMEKEFINIDKYIEDFHKQLEEIKNYPSLVKFFEGEGKRFLSEFLFNLYVLGYEEDFEKIYNKYPHFLNKKHKLLIFLNKAEDVQDLEKEIESFFNNAALKDKEDIFYIYINRLIEEEKFSDAKEKIKKFNIKNSLLPEVLTLKIKQKEEGLNIEEKLHSLKLEAMMKGNIKLVKIIDELLS